MYDLAVIVPVRRGSSRIANKSMLPFGDADSLIAWKLGQLVRVIDPGRIYLSSEDEEFLAIADRFGVRRHRRDLRLATDHIAPFRDVITGIVRDIPHAHIAWATVVCPLMAPAEYLDCFRRYHADVIGGDRDSLIGVNLLKEYFWSDGGALNYKATRDHTISQHLPDWYKVTNSLYMCDRQSILDREYFIGERPVLATLSKLAGVDIDYIEDYRIARALHAVYAEDGLNAIDPAALIDWPRDAHAVRRAA
jgi:CMP-N-acetylneuraminic acid synthetase